MSTGNISLKAVDFLQSVNILTINLSSDLPLNCCYKAACGTISMIQLSTKQIKAAQLAKRSDCCCVGRLSAVNVCNCVSVEQGIYRKEHSGSVNLLCPG